MRGGISDTVGVPIVPLVTLKRKDLMGSAAAPVTLRHTVDKYRVPVHLPTPFTFKARTLQCQHYCLALEMAMAAVQLFHNNVCIIF